MDLRIKDVSFRESEHRYFYRAHELHGVTGSIGKLCGKSFPETDTVMLATMYGHDVHKESEMWIKNGTLPSTEGGKWLIDTLIDFKEKNDVVRFESELIVSDFEGTASCIDIVAHLSNGKVILFDIKTTSVFNREYCSLQLSVYKELYERCYAQKVQGLYVVGVKSKRTFKIIDQGKDKVEKILNMNKVVRG